VRDVVGLYLKPPDKAIVLRVDEKSQIQGEFSVTLRKVRRAGPYSCGEQGEISVRVTPLALWRWLGFEFLVNRFPRYRRFWGYYLCYVVRGKAMASEFEVLRG
jgi:hypothetical protein